MNPLPRTGSYLIDSMLFALRAILFTLAVGLVIVVSALLIQATVQLTQPFTGSRSASSFLALLVFAAYIAVPTYVLATRTDDGPGDAEGDRD